MGLADFHEKLAQVDEATRQEALEAEKVAADEDAAGRILARGFMDELDKLAQSLPAAGPAPAVKAMASQAQASQKSRMKTPRVYQPAAPKGKVSMGPVKITR